MQHKDSSHVTPNFPVFLALMTMQQFHELLMAGISGGQISEYYDHASDYVRSLWRVLLKSNKTYPALAQLKGYSPELALAIFGDQYHKPAFPWIKMKPKPFTADKLMQALAQLPATLFEITIEQLHRYFRNGLTPAHLCQYYQKELSFLNHHWDKLAIENNFPE